MASTSIIHDLRNPVGAIHATAEMLRNLDPTSRGIASKLQIPQQAASKYVLNEPSRDGCEFFPNFRKLATFVSLRTCAIYNSLLVSRLLSRRRMLKIRRTANGEVVFTLSGRMDSESVAELERLFKSEADGCHMVLDLKDITLANQDAVNFLERCEASTITLKNCPAYIREWIMSQKSTRARPARGGPINGDKAKG